MIALKLIKYSLIFWSFTLQFSPSFATAIHKVVHKSTSKMSDTEFLVKAVALNSMNEPQMIPMRCNGLNFSVLAEALNANRAALAREKGEFEKSEDYISNQNNIAKTLNNIGQTHICWRLDDDDGLKFAYDAEKGEFSGEFEIHSNVWRTIKHLGVFPANTNLQ